MKNFNLSYQHECRPQSINVKKSKDKQACMKFLASIGFCESKQIKYELELPKNKLELMVECWRESLEVLEKFLV